MSLTSEAGYPRCAGCAGWGCSDAPAAMVRGARAFVSHGEKVWKTLMSIAPPRQQGVKVRKDLNGCNV